MKKSKQLKSLLVLKGLEINEKAFIVTAEADEKVYKVSKKHKGCYTYLCGTLNSYDVLNNNVIILSKDAVAKIEEVLG